MRRWVTLCVFVGLLLFSSPGMSWIYGYYGAVPFGQAPVWYMAPPGIYLHQPWPYGFNPVPLPTLSGIYTEQMELPQGYRIRVHTGIGRLQDVWVEFVGQSLVIRSGAGQTGFAGAGLGTSAGYQFGSFSQWLTLAPDARVEAAVLSVTNGLIDIFIPRRR